MSPTDLVAAEDVDSVATAAECARREGPIRREVTLVTKTGGRIPYEVTSAPLDAEAGSGGERSETDGTVRGLRGIGRDITERRERERALCHQAERLATLGNVNAVIRDVDRVLVRASTREEVKREVTERLASANPYRFAWIDEGFDGSENVTRLDE